MALAAVRSKVVVLLLSIRCRLLLSLWDSVIVLFCCALLCAHSSFAIIAMGKRELVAFLCLSSWCLVIVLWIFLTTPRVWLHFVSVVFPDHTHYFWLPFAKLRLILALVAILLIRVDRLVQFW